MGDANWFLCLHAKTLYERGKSKRKQTWKVYVVGFVSHDLFLRAGPEIFFLRLQRGVQWRLEGLVRGER